MGLVKLPVELWPLHHQMTAKLRVRSGRVQPAKGRSILLCSGVQPSTWASQLIRAFEKENPRENVFLLERCPPPHSGMPLRSGARLPYPLPLNGSTKRFLRKLRTSLVLIDEGASPPPSLISIALKNDISVAYADTREIHTNDRRRASKRELNGDSAKIIRGLATRDMPQVLKTIASEIAREVEPALNLKKKIKFIIWEKLLFRFNSHKLKKLHNLEEVKISLGNPNAILCLGNGPSSEDLPPGPETFDSVFRVNHRWIERGKFAKPDVVFTGALKSVLNVRRNVIYTFIDDSRAMRIIMKARKHIKQLSFTNASDLGFPMKMFAPYQPTNGAIMVYVAVKLSPKQLTIAGIDLYRDPRGCYPDETDTPNKYTSAHNGDLELELILRLLADYQGKLNIIGNNLATEYEQYVRRTIQKA